MARTPLLLHGPKHQCRRYKREPRGEDIALAVGDGKDTGGSSRVRWEGVTRAELQKERGGGNSPLATTNSGIGQQHRTSFCRLKQIRSGYNPAIYLDRVWLSFDASPELHGGRTRPLRLEVTRLGMGTEVFDGRG